MRRRELRNMVGKNHGVEDPLNPDDKNLPIAAITYDYKDTQIREHVVPILDDLSPGIVRPQIHASHFELKHVMFQILQTIGQYNEDCQYD